MGAPLGDKTPARGGGGAVKAVRTTREAPKPWCPARIVMRAGSSCGMIWPSPLSWSGASRPWSVMRLLRRSWSAHAIDAGDASGGWSRPCRL